MAAFGDYGVYVNKNHTVVEHIDFLIKGMPKGSKRDNVVTFIRDFNRIIKLATYMNLNKQSDGEIHLHDSLKYQGYVLELIRQDYKTKLTNLIPNYDARLVSYLKNYVFTKIKILEVDIKGSKYILDRLEAKHLKE